MTALLGRRTRRVAELEADAAMLDDLRALLAADGIHHYMLRTYVYNALVSAAVMAGDHALARRLAMAKLEMARAHDAAHGRR